MKNGFANFLDRLKDDDYPETFKLDEISTLEKMEEKLKKAKEILEPRMDKKNKNVWAIKLILFAIFMLIIFAIVGGMRDNSNGYFSYGARFWPKIALIVDAVVLILVLVFAIVEEIINQVANWKRRRNTENKVSLENGDEKNEPIETGIDCENLKDRCQKLIEDLNENYEPMRNRYKRLCNHYVFYGFVSLFIILLIMASIVIEDLFYSTKQNSQKGMSGILRFFVFIISAFFLCNSIMNEIAEDNKLKF
ncbi:unnamed protein product [Caenorhabditis nigoni]